MPSNWSERGFNHAWVGFSSFHCELVALMTTYSAPFQSEHHTTARMTWFRVHVPNRRASLGAAGMKRISSSESGILHSAPEINVERREKEFEKENKNGGSLAHLHALVAFILFLPSSQLPPPSGPHWDPHLLSIPLFFYSHCFLSVFITSRADIAPLPSPPSLSPHVSVTFLISEVFQNPFSIAVPLIFLKKTCSFTEMIWGGGTQSKRVGQSRVPRILGGRGWRSGFGVQPVQD